MRVLKFIMLVTALSGLAAGLFATALPYVKGAKLLSVQTASMSPIFRPGDAVWVENVPLHSLEAGNIISYRNPQQNNVIVSHRLISIDNEKGLFITKGDNLSVSDLPVYPGLVVGRVNRVFPKIGLLLDWLHKPAGLLLTVYAPGLFLLLSEFKRFAIRFHNTYYHLYGYK